MLILMLASVAAVTGSVQTSSSEEFFDGDVNGTRMVLVSDEGARCVGLVSGNRVDIQCRDGRTGYVIFVGDSGYGRLDGEPLLLVRN